MPYSKESRETTLIVDCTVGLVQTIFHKCINGIQMRYHISGNPVSSCGSKTSVQLFLFNKNSREIIFL